MVPLCSTLSGAREHRRPLESALQQLPLFFANTNPRWVYRVQRNHVPPSSFCINMPDMKLTYGSPFYYQHKNLGALFLLAVERLRIYIFEVSFPTSRSMTIDLDRKTTSRERQDTFGWHADCVL